MTAIVIRAHAIFMFAPKRMAGIHVSFTAPMTAGPGSMPVVARGTVVMHSTAAQFNKHQ